MLALDDPRRHAVEAFGQPADLVVAASRRPRCACLPPAPAPRVPARRSARRWSARAAGCRARRAACPTSPASDDARTASADTAPARRRSDSAAAAPPGLARSARPAAGDREGAALAAGRASRARAARATRDERVDRGVRGRSIRRRRRQWPAASRCSIVAASGIADKLFSARISRGVELHREDHPADLASAPGSAIRPRDRSSPPTHHRVMAARLEIGRRRARWPRRSARAARRSRCRRVRPPPAVDTPARRLQRGQRRRDGRPVAARHRGPEPEIARQHVGGSPSDLSTASPIAGHRRCRWRPVPPSPTLRVIVRITACATIATATKRDREQPGIQHRQFRPQPPESGRSAAARSSPDRDDWSRTPTAPIAIGWARHVVGRVDRRVPDAQLARDPPARRRS